MKNTTNVRHDELVIGDLVWNTGHLFRVGGLRQYITDGVTVIRYAGEIVDAADELKGTGYDGAQYGARADYPATIVVRGGAR